MILVVCVCIAAAVLGLAGYGLWIYWHSDHPEEATVLWEPPPPPAVGSPKQRRESPASPEAPRISRFANIEAPSQVLPEQEFPVEVSLTREKRSNETALTGLGEMARLDSRGALDLDCPEPCVLTAVLFAPGFDITSGSNRAQLRVEQEADGEPAHFTLRGRKGLDGVDSRLSAQFWRKGAFVASIRRDIAIGKPKKPAAEPPKPPPTNTTVVLQPRPTADLTVRWEEKDVGSQHFCLLTVDSPALSSLASDLCTPGEQIEKFLAQRYNGSLRSLLRGVIPVGDAAPPPSPQQTISQLRGLGRELYQQFATRNFRSALDKLRAGPAANGGFELRTIQINTNNPALPWELMVPCADDSCGFLGVDYQMARWHISDGTADLAPQTIPYKTLVAIAPHYQGASYLPNQSKELQALQVVPMYRASGGKLDDFRRALESADNGIVHFAGHGRSDNGYQIILEDASADPTMIRGWNRGKGSRLYFWNACDSGQEKTVAGFVDGWAPALLDNGAGGFIGGMWPLQDASAAQFAGEFYLSLEHGLNGGPAVPVAQLMQAGRRQFLKTGDPTFLAYVFYGDVRLLIKP